MRAVNGGVGGVHKLGIIGRLGSVVGVQSVPLGGVLAQGWSPASGVIFYLLEAFVALFLTLALIAVYRWKRPDQRGELERQNVRAKDVLAFHGGSLFVMSGFFAGLLLILSSKKDARPPSWEEIALGLPWLLLLAIAGWAFDLIGISDRPPSFVRESVDRCMKRWGFLWLLGFFGPIAMALSGRPAAFFAFFAGLKLLFEVWGVVARARGWKSLAERRLEGAGSANRFALKRPGLSRRGRLRAACCSPSKPSPSNLGSARSSRA